MSMKPEQRNGAISVVRTLVPMAVGAFATWLGHETGVILDDDTRTGIIIGLTGTLSSIYYVAARALERRWPVLGVLLGSRSQPEYSKAA